MTPSDTLDLAAKLVTSFVSNNSLPAGELPALIQIIHAALMRLKDRAETPAPEEQKPAVSIRAVNHAGVFDLSGGRQALQVAETALGGAWPDPGAISREMEASV